MEKNNKMVSELISLAKPILLDAGGILKKRIKNKDEILYEVDKDIKISSDFLINDFIIEKLKKISGLPILSEESPHKNFVNKKGNYWVLDPLDGSFNYLKGIPFCCISLGLWCKEEPLAGIIFDFIRNELFEGIINSKAKLNNNPIIVSNTDKKGRSVIGTGFPSFTDFSSNNLNNFILKIQEYKKVRLFGSAALSLAYTACGRTDAYSEDNIKFWDVAGGIPIVIAAGGYCNFKFKPDFKMFVYATNSKI